MGMNNSKSGYDIFSMISGKSPIDFEEEVWDNLFKNFSFDSSIIELKQLFLDSYQHIVELVRNASATKNLEKFLLHSLRLLRDCTIIDQQTKISRESLQKAENALILVRLVTQYLLENVNTQIPTLLGNWSDELGSYVKELEGSSISECLINTTIEYVIQSKCKNENYHLYKEALNLLIILLSSDIYLENLEPESNFFLGILSRQKGAHSPQHLVKALLNNFCQQKSVAAKSNGEKRNITSFFSSILSLSSKFVLFPLIALVSIFKKIEAERDASVPHLSLFLLVLLSNTFREVFGQIGDVDNPMMESNHITTNNHTLENNNNNNQPNNNNTTNNINEKNDVNNNTDNDNNKIDNNNNNNNNVFGDDKKQVLFTISYDKLYDTFSKTMRNDSSILLFYVFLNKNPSFFSYVISKTDQETFLVHLLYRLYVILKKEDCDQYSESIYMVIVLLLILSQEKSFAYIQQLKISHVPWYKEQILNNITLADLIVIVLSYTIQNSLPKSKNSYILTTSLAVLANIASHFENLHSLAAMRLVRLFELISNKYLKSIGYFDKIGNNDVGHPGSNGSNGLIGEVVVKESEVIDMKNTSTSDKSFETSLLADFLATILDIINTCVSKNLIQNKNIIYSLVYKKNVFERINSLEGKFQWTVCLNNIFQVIYHFHQAISTIGDERDRTVNVVLDKIEHGVLTWTSDCLTPLQSLFYRYTEESNSFEFFAPYSWKIVYRYSSLFWDASNIKLFYLPDFADSSSSCGRSDVPDEFSSDFTESPEKPLHSNSHLNFHVNMNGTEKDLKDDFENIDLESPPPARKALDKI